MLDSFNRTLRMHLPVMSRQVNNFTVPVQKPRYFTSRKHLGTVVELKKDVWSYGSGRRETIFREEGARHLQSHTDTHVPIIPKMYR